jgi:hypothetical protein
VKSSARTTREVAAVAASVFCREIVGITIEKSRIRVAANSKILFDSLMVLLAKEFISLKSPFYLLVSGAN